MTGHKYSYRWSLADLPTPNRGTVFSCFSGGGGSSMGYKLAGFDVIGCNDIDTQMMDVYQSNLHPRLVYQMDIRDLVKNHNLSNELFELDILDGSPPCSTFSMMGSREETWGKKRFFKEGQKEQVLDTLFFDFIALAHRLQPKVCIAENVMGLLYGDAAKYVGKIYESFDSAGYYCQHYPLNAASMGVPQNRKRVFFVGLRKDLAQPFLRPYNLFEDRPPLDMEFQEEPIVASEIIDHKGDDINDDLMIAQLWHYRQKKDRGIKNIAIRQGKTKRMFIENSFIHPEEVCPTLVARKDGLVHYDKCKWLSVTEATLISSFPTDYDFKSMMPHYVLGMSVPPVMMAQVASRIHDQWLSKLHLR